jgi:hypothetical protein
MLAASLLTSSRIGKALAGGTLANSLISGSNMKRVITSIAALSRPHAEEPAKRASRSMRPPPSFETLAALAPQDEGGAKFAGKEEKRA